MTKIGVIAPFEGLSRRSGYAALAAVRGALADAAAAADGTSGAMAILPLALDDGDNPQQARRSMEKLLIDPTVAAIIGPLTPWAAAGAASVTQDDIPLWLPPFAIAPDSGFADPRTDNAWADAWVAAIAAAVRDNGGRRLVLAGWTPGWPAYHAEEWAASAAMPVILDDDPTAVQAGDAVLWLGPAADGADYLATLRASQSEAPFWLGMQGADPVFGERAVTLENAYWTIWSPVEYNFANAPNFPTAPDAQLVYLAAKSALDHITTPQPVQPLEWRFNIYRFTASGESVPIN